MTGRTSWHTLMPCPWCGRLNNGATDARGGDDMPERGDAMFCIGCGQWQIFEMDHMRRPNPTEAAELAADPFCRAMVKNWEQIGPPPGQRARQS